VTVVPVRWLTVFLDFPADSFGAGVAFWAEVMAGPADRFYRLTTIPRPAAP
jgi:hypothetical protein